MVKGHLTSCGQHGATVPSWAGQIVWFCSCFCILKLSGGGLRRALYCWTRYTQQTDRHWNIWSLPGLKCCCLWMDLVRTQNTNLNRSLNELRGGGGVHTCNVFGWLVICYLSEGFKPKSAFRQLRSCSYELSWDMGLGGGGYWLIAILK